jgi:hypothetical protein
LNEELKNASAQENTPSQIDGFTIERQCNADFYSEMDEIVKTYEGHPFNGLWGLGVQFLLFFRILSILSILLLPPYYYGHMEYMEGRYGSGYKYSYGDKSAARYSGTYKGADFATRQLKGPNESWGESVIRKGDDWAN